MQETSSNSFDEVEKNITFFIKRGDTGQDKPAVKPLAEEASSRGYDIHFTGDFSQSAEIGVYVRSRGEVNAKFSAIMFHGIDDAYMSDYWSSLGTDWRPFDIGFLPGEKALDNWKKQSHHPKAKPEIGVCNVGWPKADRVGSDIFRSAVSERKVELGLNDGRNIIYAPTSEGSGKIHQFIDHCGEVADNLLIKHAPYESLNYTAEYKSLSELYEELRTLPDVHILDPQEEIMECLALADILVSDQSSVLNEAMLTDTVPVSVSDWPIRGSGTAADKEYRTPVVQKIPLSGLTTTLEEIYEGYDKLIVDMQAVREEYYSHFGSSSKMTIDVIESLLEDNEPPVPLHQPDNSLPIHREYYAVRDQVVGNIPEPVKDKLVRLRVHEAEATVRKNVQRLASKFSSQDSDETDKH